MKLYSGMSPNGLRVGVFMQEKGIDLPVEMFNVTGGETRSDAYLKMNSLGEVPVLELDDGSFLTESVAICRYLEALHPQSPLLGTGPEEQARIEMWNRRMELKIFNCVGDVGLHEFEFFADRVEQVPEYAAAKRREIVKRLEWLDGELSDGRSFIAGDTFSIADITGMAALMVCAFAGIEIPEGLANVKRWEASLKARPSWPQMPG